MKDQHESQHRLDEVLSKHLGQVEAPPELWREVNGRRVAGQSRSFGFTPTGMQWAASAAAVILVITAAWQWKSNSTPQIDAVEQLALSALAQPVEHLALVTNNAVETRKWIKEQAGIETLLPPRHEPQVRILGADISRTEVGGTMQAVAEIAYQVGGHRATLLVTKDPSNSKTYPTHEARTGGPNDSRVTSWNMRGHSYILATSAPGREYREACLLCHDAGFPALQSPQI